MHELVTANMTEQATTVPPKNLYIVGYIIVVYTILFFVGLFGNSLVLIVIIKQVSMQNITNFFIANQAVCDILIALLTIPSTVLFFLLSPFRGNEALCQFAAGFSILFPVYVSSWNLVAIAIDRCFIILNPLKKRMQNSTFFLLISLIWIMAALLTVPHIINLGLLKSNDSNISYCNEIDNDWSDRYSVLTLICQFLVPVMVMSLCYSLIGIYMRRRARNKIGSGSANKLREENEMRRSKKMNKLLISMVIVYVICWIPHNLFTLVRFAHGTEFWFNPNLTTFIHFSTHSIAMSSSIYNPLLYAFLNENFKQEFKRLLPCFGTSWPKNAGVPVRSINRKISSKQPDAFVATNDTNNNLKPPEDRKPLYTQETDFL